MKPVHVGATAMQQCDACNGSWLTTDTFTNLCTDREAQSALASTVGGATPASGSLRLNTVRYRRCAACQKMMNRVNFGRVSGVVIDLCKGHGVWFDAGELQGVLAFVANGGLERMRESEAEFKELSKKAWAAGATPSGGRPIMQSLSSETTFRFHITSNDDDSAPLRQLLTFLLT